MRTALIAGVIAALIPACSSGIEGVGGGGGDDGSGSGSADAGIDPETPHVELSVDKGSITSDLNVEQTITVTATSVAGFAGDVTLGVQATDSTSTVLTDWSSSLDQPTLTLSDGGSATTTLKLSALGDVGSLAGTLTVSATGAPANAATVDVTFNPVLVITIQDVDGACVYPDSHNTSGDPWLVKSGRMFRIINGSATLKLVVHTNFAIDGFDHEGDTGTPPGMAYENTLTGDDVQDEFYCHTPGGGGAIVEVGGTTNTRNQVRVVQ
jgi:hypothetical protein